MALCIPGGRAGGTTLVMIGMYCTLQMPFVSGYPRCIIKLGAAGYVHGFDIDTSHFNGVLDIQLWALFLNVLRQETKPQRRLSKHCSRKEKLTQRIQTAK